MRILRIALAVGLFAAYVYDSNRPFTPACATADIA
jgi:hypothetical protein